MEAEPSGAEEPFDRVYRDIILDLRDLRLADRDAVTFLRRCDANGTNLENCPAYAREWIAEKKIESMTNRHGSRAPT
jgi:hypothetical protein